MMMGSSSRSSWVLFADHCADGMVDVVDATSPSSPRGSRAHSFFYPGLLSHRRPKMCFFRFSIVSRTGRGEWS
jgi:hypothetical protein